jgi:hypothetical protein
MDSGSLHQLKFTAHNVTKVNEFGRKLLWLLQGNALAGFFSLPNFIVTSRYRLIYNFG